MLASGSTVQTWLEPAQRPEHISTLINSVDRYNPQNLDTLHAYLDQQIQEGFHDGLANLATLKLYQFNPASYDHDVVVSILIKALLALPYPDFKLSLALLGEAPLSMDTASSPSFSLSKSEQKTEDATETPTSPALASVAQVPESYLAGNIRDPLIQRLAKLQLLLSNAHFVQFWEALKSEDYAAVRNSLKSVPTFDTDVRRLVIETVAPAFKRISCARLAKYLDLPVGELPAFVAKVDGWKVEGDYVVVPPNADNEIKAVTVNEQIQVEQLHKLIVQATPAPFPAAN